MPDRCESHNGATTLTRDTIGGSGGVASPDLLDMHLLFNGVATDESTQTEVSYLRKLFDIGCNTRLMSMNGIGPVTVVTYGSNNGDNDTTNVGGTSVSHVQIVIN